MEKLVSVIVNCYNGEKYLKDALKSIQNQKYSKWELIFWDNQSTDKSKEIFNSFKDERFKYFYADRHTTLYEARNLACKKSNGEFIAFLDCDDWWYDDFLLERKIFFDDEKYKFSYSNCDIYFEKSNRYEVHSKENLQSGKIYDFLSKNYLVRISSLIVGKKSLEEINFFNSGFNIIGDFDAVMKISKTGEAYATQKTLLCVRIHGKNFQDENRQMFFKEYKDWFFSQVNDEFFNKNRLSFFKKLIYLYFVSLFPKFLKDLFKKK